MDYSTSNYVPSASIVFVQIMTFLISLDTKTIQCFAKFLSTAVVFFLCMLWQINKRKWRVLFFEERPQVRKLMGK